MNWRLIRIIDKFLGIPLILLYAAFRGTRKNTAACAAPKRILCIKFWGIGNIFMMLPTVYALKKRYPAASITLLTLTQNAAAADALDAFDETIYVDTSSPVRFASTLAAAVRTLVGAFDLVVDFEEFARISAILAIITRAPHSIGFATHGQFRHAGYSHDVAYSDRRHIVRTFASLLTPLGIAVDEQCRPYPFKTRTEDLAERPFILIHPGSSENFALRRWPAEHVAAFIKKIIATSDISVILTGTRGERSLCEKIKILAGNETRVAVDCARTFVEYAQLIGKSALVVAADTGAVHIASYFSRPVIGLYGPNTAAVYGPWSPVMRSLSANLPCSPCITNFNDKFHVCRHPLGKGYCMRMISPESVAEAAKGLLSS